MWAASDRESYLTLLYSMDTSVTGDDGVGMFVVERTRGIDGSAEGSGFHVWRWAAAATVTTFAGGYTRVYGAQAQPPTVDNNPAVLIPDAFNTNGAFIANTSYAFPIYTYTPPFVKGASKALMYGFPTDWPRGQSVTVDHYGEPMTFVSLGDGAKQNIAVLNNTGAGAAGVKSVMPLIRWD